MDDADADNAPENDAKPSLFGWILKQISGVTDEPKNEDDTESVGVCEGVLVQEPLTDDDNIDMVVTKRKELTYEQVINNAVFLKLELPRIVVIGNESSGKSSTLERICRREVFPRAEKMCTKQPIELKLRTAPNIREDSATFILTLPGEIPLTLENEHAVRDMIEAHMQNHPVGSESIKIEIHANDIPTFDLVDLPGLYTSKKSESDTDKERIEQCVRSYIESEDIGAVVIVLNARSSIIQDNALKMIQEISRNGREICSFCIAAFAKCDKIIDNEWQVYRKSGPLHELLDKLFENKEELAVCQAGCVALKNRDSSRPYVSLQHQIKDEDSFFLANFDGTNSANMVEDLASDVEQSPPKKLNKRRRGNNANDIPLPAGRAFTAEGMKHLGINALITQIDKVFCLNLAWKWVPDKLKELTADKERIMHEVSALGRNPRDISLRYFIDHSNHHLQRVFARPDVYVPIWNLIFNIHGHGSPGRQSIPVSEVDVVIRTINVRNTFVQYFQSGQFIHDAIEILTQNILQEYNTSDNDLKFHRFLSHQEALIASLNLEIMKASDAFLCQIRHTIHEIFRTHGSVAELSYIINKIRTHLIYDFTEHVILNVIGSMPSVGIAFAQPVFDALPDVPEESCAHLRMKMVQRIEILTEHILNLRRFQKNNCRVIE